MQHEARPKRKWARRGARVALSLAALVALAIVLLHTPFGQERLRALVEKSVGARTNGRVHLDELRFRLFGELALRGLHISDPGGTEAIAVDELRVGPSWTQLLRGRIVVDHVDLSGVRVHAQKDESGALSLEKLFKPAPPSEPLDARIDVRHLGIRGVEVVIDQPGGAESSSTMSI